MLCIYFCAMEKTTRVCERCGVEIERGLIASLEHFDVCVNSNMPDEPQEPQRTGRVDLYVGRAFLAKYGKYFGIDGDK